MANKYVIGNLYIQKYSICIAKIVLKIHELPYY